MGSRESLFDRLSFARDNPFADYEDGQALDVDAVVSGSVRDPGVRPAGLTVRPEWGAQAAAVRRWEGARPGWRVVGDDPHILGLGAYGVPAVFATPAQVGGVAAERRIQLGRPRRVLVQVNGPAAPGLGPVDVASALVRETGLEGLSGAIVEFSGPGVEAMTLAEREDLCASAGPSGARVALGPWDARAASTWSGGPSPREGAVRGHDEFVIVNADESRPLLLDPRDGRVIEAAAAGSRVVREVRVGGCVGGHEEELAAWARALSETPVRAGVNLLVVPQTRELFERVSASDLGAQLAAVGARLVAPSDVWTSGGQADLVACSCLGPASLVAGASTLRASAQAGRLTPGVA